MKSRTYLTDYKRTPTESWYQVKPGAGALAVAQTTPIDEMYIAGELHDMTTLDPAELLSRFEDYEDADYEGEEWVI